MSRALRAELLKVRTTRLWWGLLIGLALLVVLNAAVLAAFAGTDTGPGGPTLPALDTSEGFRSALSSGFQSGYLLAAVLGTIIGATDNRHRTATQTFLATPSRARVVVAKMLAGGVFGAVYAVVTQFVSLVVVSIVAAIRGAGTQLGDASVLRALVLGVPGVMVWCVIGVSLGVLLRNQVAAILVAVGVIYLVDTLLSLGLHALHADEVVKFTPNNASTAVVEGFTGYELLPWWGGVLVLLAYSAVIAGCGWWLSLRRDIA
ncbi:MAG TPA: ABC transporter permease [Actinomycetales bacterium]|nr:ABC transporter permease [Actinomycetales bacterium]